MTSKLNMIHTMQLYFLVDYLNILFNIAPIFEESDEIFAEKYNWLKSGKRKQDSISLMNPYPPQHANFIYTICLALRFVKVLITFCLIGVSSHDDEYPPCPRGTYRALPSVSNCTPCPKGLYNPFEGATVCASSCPPGRYKNTFGGVSIDDCTLCPAGKYGSSPGLTTSGCTASCARGFYSTVIGASTSSVCIPCPKGYMGNFCPSKIAFREGYINGG